MPRYQCMKCQELFSSSEALNRHVNRSFPLKCEKKSQQGNIHMVAVRGLTKAQIHRLLLPHVTVNNHQDRDRNYFLPFIQTIQETPENYDEDSKEIADDEEAIISRLLTLNFYELQRNRQNQESILNLVNKDFKMNKENRSNNL